MISLMSKTKEQLEEEIEHLKKVVGTLIVWISQSAESPIRPTEAKELIKMLETTIDN